MIRQLDKKDLDAVASAHLHAWQTGFKNILSDNLLAALTKDEFLQAWRQTIRKSTRLNFVSTSDDRPVAFVSFGPSLDSQTNAEIYGIYVDPKHWGQGHGKQLIQKAIEELSKNNFSTVLLWVMTKNNSARQFYENFGFKNSSVTRTSERKNETFDECKYTLDL